jgi:hypothetical protein
MGVDLLFGPIEIEKKRDGTPRIALRAAEYQRLLTVVGQGRNAARLYPN